MTNTISSNSSNLLGLVGKEKDEINQRELRTETTFRERQNSWMRGSCADAPLMNQAQQPCNMPIDSLPKFSAEQQSQSKVAKRTSDLPRIQSLALLVNNNDVSFLFYIYCLTIPKTAMLSRPTSSGMGVLHLHNYENKLFLRICWLRRTAHRKRLGSCLK